MLVLSIHYYNNFFPLVISILILTGKESPVIRKFPVNDENQYMLWFPYENMLQTPNKLKIVDNEYNI